ncbi:MAG: hypothetical protein ABIF19_07850 [Planctomycetota bacterium]
MNRWLLVVAAVLLLLVLGSAAGRSMQNSAINNPVGPATVPPSSIRNGLLETASPIDNTGNLLITGNVRRGRHFRGDVPYQSTTSFTSSLGSSTLSSFLRDTAGSEDYTRPSYGYGAQPYYSSTETVASSIPGQSGVLSPANTRISTRVQQDTSTVGANLFSLESLPRQQDSFSRGTTGSDLDSQRPQTQYAPLPPSRYIRTEFPSTMESTPLREMSPGQRDTGRLPSGQIDVRRQGESLTAERFNRLNNYEGATAQDSAQLADPGRQQGLFAADTSLRYPSQETGIENLKSTLEIQPSSESDIGTSQTAATRYGLPASRQFAPSPAPGERTNLSAADAGKAKASTLSPAQRDVLERIKQQLDDLTRSFEAGLQVEPAATDDKLPSAAFGEASPGQRYMPEPRSTSSLYEPQAAELPFDEEPPAHLVPGAAAGRDYEGGQARLELPAMAGGIGSKEKSSPLEELNKLSQADLSAEAKRIMGPHRSVESFSQARYNQHMLAAEANLRNGRYYNAADFFAMASIYKPDDPQAIAGRGHALFAAGDYTSSALFISRALTVSPEYMQTRIDLTAMLGGQDKLAAGIEDVERWFQRSGSTELQLLLAYVYYRAGGLNQAKQAIDALYQKMPQSPSVRAIKAAIDKPTTIR